MYVCRYRNKKIKVSVMSIAEENILSLEEMDALKEVFNIGIGKAASTLNQMINKRILLNAPEMELFRSKEKLLQVLEENMSLNNAVKMGVGFEGFLNGNSTLLLDDSSAKTLVSILNDIEDEDELEAFIEPTLQEIANILLNNVMGSISNMSSSTLKFKVPSFGRVLGRNDVFDNDSDVFILVQCRFSVKEVEISGNIGLSLDVLSIDNLKAMFVEMNS